MANHDKPPELPVGASGLLNLQRCLLPPEHLRAELNAEFFVALARRAGAPFQALVESALQSFLRADLCQTVVEPLQELGWERVIVRMIDSVPRDYSPALASSAVPASRRSTASWSQLRLPLVLLRSRRDCAIVSASCDWVLGERGWQAQESAGRQLQEVGSLTLVGRESPSSELLGTTRDFVTQMAAPTVHAGSLLGFCETLLGILMTNAGAAHAALHVGRELDSIFTGEAALVLEQGNGVRFGPCTSGSVGAPPRRDGGGIGSEALSSRREVHIAGDELARRNKELYAIGVRSTTALPLFSGRGDCIGVAYLHYLKEDARSMAELATVAGDALGRALDAESQPVQTRGTSVSGALRVVQVASRFGAGGARSSRRMPGLLPAITSQVAHVGIMCSVPPARSEPRVGGSRSMRAAAGQ